MSLNNDNNLHCVVVPLGSLSADALVPALTLHHNVKIEHVDLMNGDDIDASDTNFVDISLKNGSNAIASYNSKSANQGAISKNVASAMVIDDDYSDVADGDALTVNYDETDSGTSVALTNAVLVIWLKMK